MIQIERVQTKEYFDGRFVGDFKDSMESIVSHVLKLRRDGEPPTLDERKRIIDVICDSYIEQTGERPDGVQVQRLANWLLLEDLADNHPDKVSRNDYPVMTKRQLRTRYHRERADENIPETHSEQRYLEGRKQPHYKTSEQ